MNSFLLQKALAVNPDGLEGPFDFRIQDGKIVEKGAELTPDHGETVVDAKGKRVWPGLIDMHIHGAEGHVLAPGQGKALESLSRTLARHGVTRFLATFPPLPEGGLEKMLTEYHGVPPETLTGALPLGVHIEGPYLNPCRTGALPPDGLRDPDQEDFARIIEAGAGQIRVMTIAPELPRAVELIKAGVDADIIMAAGHTEASFSEMESAVEAGLSHITHCFNAMRRFSHRSPGAAEAALTLPGLTVEAICDGRHLHKAVFDIMLRCRQSLGVLLVTDATALDAPDGSSLPFFGNQLEVRRGMVRDTRTGALGGSTVSLWRCVQNVLSWGSCTRPQASTMASFIPAHRLGLHDQFGRVETGYTADFFIEGENGTVEKVWRDGLPIWQADDLVTLHE